MVQSDKPVVTYSIANAIGSEARGEVAVWSEGAQATRCDDGDVVELRIVFELVNRGPELLTFDRSAFACASLLVGGVAQPVLSPAGVHGELMAAPGTNTRVALTYRTPAVNPRDVGTFLARFAVRSGERTVLEQQTHFVAVHDQTHVPGYYGWPWGAPWTGSYGGAYYGYHGPWRIGDPVAGASWGRVHAW